MIFETGGYFLYSKIVSFGNAETGLRIFTSSVILRRKI